MDPLPGQRVEIGRESRHQSFSFTGFEFSYAALVKDNPAKKLCAKGKLSDNAMRGLADRSICVRENIIETLPVRQPRAKPVRCAFQLGFSHRSIGLFEGFNLIDQRFEPLDLSVTVCSEYFLDQPHAVHPFLRSGEERSGALDPAVFP